MCAVCAILGGKGKKELFAKTMAAMDALAHTDRRAAAAPAAVTRWGGGWTDALLRRSIFFGPSASELFGGQDRARIVRDLSVRILRRPL